jgi:cyclic beta-1,2-glucan synthetase
MTEAKEYGIYMANIEQLKQFVKEMATEHKSAVYRKNGRSRIRIPLLEEDNEVLIQAYKSTNEEVKSKGNIIPAAEWLLDNYYIIEEQFKGIQYTVRKEFYKRLPLLVEGKYRDYPRIYGIAAQMVEILDGSIDEETLMAFLKHYQSYIHLTSKELWVFPIMLRICLLEKIKDVALLITDTIKLRKQADLWAVKLVESLPSSNS